MTFGQVGACSVSEARALELDQTDGWAMRRWGGGAVGRCRSPESRCSM